MFLNYISIVARYITLLGFEQHFHNYCNIMDYMYIGGGQVIRGRQCVGSEKWVVPF